ncbi:hypothetical protein EII25_07325 [Erysipelotrichaceae bacterium OH741_COT-311]|nr:hypothetical protein EII25_07325 [Erysipelotrichaceae bacterium OH741_COT-311]
MKNKKLEQILFTSFILFTTSLIYSLYFLGYRDTKEPVTLLVGLSDIQEVKILEYEFVNKEVVVPYGEIEEVLLDDLQSENGIPWLISKVSDGALGSEKEVYREVYLHDQLLGNTLIPYSNEITEPTPTVYSYGSDLVEGAYFYSRKITTYGVDCDGCHVNEHGQGGTSSGIMLSLDSVRQSDGTWKPGITYDGYYLVATDRALPFCTVLKFTNPRIEGSGLSSGEEFYALVVDRGGAIDDSDIDFFVGSEVNPLARNYKRKGVKIEIVQFGRRIKNSLGQRMCKVD